MISRFFIDRPIFAAVLSIVITLAGGLSVFTLPLAQFPQITPPTVAVSCNYPGASAKEVSDAVATPIEQQVNGVENMMYMQSQCGNDGSYSLTVTFRPGVDLDMAQVLVQNRVNLALQQLPEVIRRTGVTTRKRSPDILMGIAIHSPDDSYDQLYLSNYALMQIRDELTRLPGVGDVNLFGQRDYSMRIRVDPDRLAARQLTAQDVVRAIREQNAPVAAGAIGQEPNDQLQQTQVTLSTTGRLTNQEQFEQIILKRSPDGRLVRLKDVGYVELDAKSQDISTRMDGKSTIFLAVFQMPDANALDVHRRAMDKVKELSANFPPGVKYEIGFDTTPYTRESIREVLKTLRDAVILVAAVVLLFLQNWRSAIIPLVAVPVAIIGTFAAMAMFGFSLNNLTLFGLVLAIGIVVDDAIVVVEAVEHHIEHGLSSRDATIAAMRQVSGPVIAVGLVLSAVFVPCAFISGITGQFFRQFALTIAVSTIISAFNSLTLSPALTALLLKPIDDEVRPPLPRIVFPIFCGWLGWVMTDKWAGKIVPADWLASANGFSPWTVTVAGGVLAALLGWFISRPINRLLGGGFRLFHRAFGVATNGYVRMVGGLLRITIVVLLVYGGLLLVTYRTFKAAPRGFIPAQDMGYLMVNVQLPDSASVERTNQVMRRIEKLALSIPGVRHVTGTSGQSMVLNAAGSNFGSAFVNLDFYPDRRQPDRSSNAIADKLRKLVAAEIPDANVAVFPPPAVRGVGRAGGFTMMVQDRGDVGSNMLQQQVEHLVRKGNETKGLAGLFSVFRANVPQIHIDVDTGAAMMRGVSLQDFADTLQVYEGSLYVNDFNLFGRTWQVVIQADSPFRDQPEDIPQLRVRNSQGRMVPIGSVARQREVNGPLVMTRYNMRPAAGINGSAVQGYSSRQVIDMMENLANEELPPNMGFEWTDMSYLELMAGNTAMTIFAFAVMMVFLVLAAQYESWGLPLAVILVVPMCLLSALVGVNYLKMDVNIFTQIGFVVLVGLASKNAILIVEFARQQRHEGLSRREATLAACRLRLRPIVMTSLAFILGVLPLVVSIGAGAEMRRALGTAVFSGMVGVTLFGIVLTPVFFFVIDWLGESPVFASRIARTLGGWGLDVLAMRPVRRAAWRAMQYVASRAKGLRRG